MNNRRRTSLVLFFTRGISLHTWDKIGMIDREVALYRRLQEHGLDVSFVTYGNAEDLRYADRIPGIRILCNRWRLPPSLYARVLPMLHAPQLWGANIFKTNQVLGAEIALRPARLYRKPLIARCGYLSSEFAAHQHGPSSRQAQTARRAENRVFRAADRVVVTTKTMQETVIREYGLWGDGITVIPNYVCTDAFYPHEEMRNANTICFVGRLNEQKNPLGLLQALAELDVHLIMIGDGVLRPKVESLAHQLGLDMTLIQRVPHMQLPSYLNQASLFILPSFYEGHPKTLLEAMACGLPVIGTDVPGIRELIKHRETGYLCGTAPGEIRAAVRDVLADKTLQTKLGRNARRFVVENFSLERVLEKEVALLQEVVNEREA